LNADGIVHMPAVHQMAKSRQVKPAVDTILSARNIDAQAALLHAVTDHTSFFAAYKLARISLPKEQAAHKVVCEQSTRIM